MHTARFLRRVILTCQLFSLVIGMAGAASAGETKTLVEGNSLKRTLAKMGMRDAFGPEADLSGLTGKSDLFISEAFHKA